MHGPLNVTFAQCFITDSTFHTHTKQQVTLHHCMPVFQPFSCAERRREKNE